MCYILHWPIVSKSGIEGAHIQYYYCNKLVKSWLENMTCLERRMNACGALVVCFSIELLDFVARLGIYQLRWTHRAPRAFILVSKHTLFKQKTKLIRFRILVSWGAVLHENVERTYEATRCWWVSLYIIFKPKLNQLWISLNQLWISSCFWISLNQTESAWISSATWISLNQLESACIS